jgi:hypothetical protein
MEVGRDKHGEFEKDFCNQILGMLSFAAYLKYRSSWGSSVDIVESMSTLTAWLQGSYLSHWVHFTQLYSMDKNNTTNPVSNLWELNEIMYIKSSQADTWQY